MCCESQWTKTLPLIGGLSGIQCMDSGNPGTELINVSVQLPAVLISVKWYKWNGSEWIFTGDTTEQIEVTEEVAQYLALIITDTGSTTLTIDLPCTSEGFWEFPDGIDWEFPDGNEWEWPS